MRKREYNGDLNPYENLALEIYQTIDSFQKEQKGYSSLELDKEILTNLNFEIVNDFYDKNVLISYVLKPSTSIIEIELHLMFLGINKEFLNNSNPNKKRYLTVWI